MWDAWASLVGQAVSAIPLSDGTVQAIPAMYTVGNHEHVDANFTSFRERIVMPFASAAETRFWYSFDHGMVHFCIVDTQANETGPTPAQLAFIEADLAAAANPAIRWIVLSGHRPHLSSVTEDWSQHIPSSPLFRSMSPLLHRYGVDLVLAGHHHAAEVCHPVSPNGTVTDTPINGTYYHPHGPVNIMQGTAGILIPGDGGFAHPPPPWSLASTRNGHYGFGRVTVTFSSLTYDHVRSEGGGTAFSVRIEK
jgi:hypothetical protein